MNTTLEIAFAADAMAGGDAAQLVLAPRAIYIFSSEGPGQSRRGAAADQAGRDCGGDLNPEPAGRPMMSMPTLPMDGGCRCGQVRFRISAPPLLTMACHCTGCQRMTASAFSLSAAIPSQGFAVTRGEAVLGGLKGEIRHHFCPSCMSWMFTRMDGMDWFVNVRATMLDDPSWFVPFAESWTSEKLPWATTPAVHSYGGFPPMKDFPRLTEEFARQGGAAAAGA